MSASRVWISAMRWGSLARSASASSAPRSRSAASTISIRLSGPSGASCGSRPMRARAGSAIEPCSGAISPAITRNSVDLPAPLRPISPTRAPAGTRAEAPSSRLRPAMRTERSSITSMRPVLAGGAPGCKSSRCRRIGRRSGGAKGGGEVFLLVRHQFGLPCELRRGVQHQRRRGAGLVGRRGDDADIFRDLAGPERRLLDVVRDLQGRGLLLLDGTRDLGRNAVDLADGLADPADRPGRGLRLALDTRDLRANLFGGLGGLIGETLDLGGNDGEALAGLAGARRLDRGVEGEQVGLGGHVFD